MYVNTNRPGVFSSYSLTSLYGGGADNRCAALVTPLDLPEDELPKPQWLTGLSGFSQEGLPAVPRLTRILKVLQTGGLGRVYLCFVPRGAGGEAWRSAFEKALAQEDVYALLWDPDGEGNEVEALLPVLKDALEENAAARRERIAVCGVDDPDQALAWANLLNCERVVLCAPAAQAGEEPAAAVYCAAALTAALLTAGDPAASFSGAGMAGLTDIPQPAGEMEIEAMLAGGVTPFEVVGGQVECVRALTTRTMTRGASDRTFAPVNTIMIVDDVMAALRQCLRGQLAGTKNNTQGFEAVASQALMLLADKKEAGLITAYAAPKVYPKPGDPSVCVVEVGFNVAFVVNQIHIQAYIQA